MITDPEEILHAHHELVNTIAGLRDKLKDIAGGEIERGHASPGEKYWASVHGPGMRKTTLKDARKIAAHVIAAIDRAIRKFEAKVYPNPFDRKDDSP